MSREEERQSLMEIDIEKNRYPCCIVWTPIPILTWLLPLIGHMGICTSQGVIRDFAGPYFVSEDHMAFGAPTKYWRLDPTLSQNEIQGWNEAVSKASNIYCKQMVSRKKTKREGRMRMWKK
ncbi:Transmembrane protein [Sarcoptes scabiei]|uniref:Transmembrane protein n=1 Tax=Sarcoptes scabiei TaxID=52283 RepID=A0A834VDY8_SARSC|nr:Transmembrane protein [Sarcoptes scabiei]